MSVNELIHCRFCAEQKSTDQIIDLKSQWSLRNEIVSKLSIFSSVCVDFDLKDLPETICNACFNSLSAANEFFDKAKKSQTVLSDLFSCLKHVKQEKERGNTENAVSSSLQTIVKVETYEVDVEFEDSCDDSIDFNDTPTVSTATSWENYAHFVCKHCDGQFDSIVLLREHCKDEHGVCNGLKCSQCQLEFMNCDSFFQHMRRHSENLSCFCPYCYINIVNIDHPQHDHYCQHCGELFPDRPSLIQHLKTYAKSEKVQRQRLRVKKTLPILLGDKEIETWNDYVWICRYCTVEEDTADLLKQHTKQVHGKCFGLKCIDCSDTILSFPTFVDHVVGHRSNLKKYCAYCNYKFEEDREQHIAQHQSELQCKLCVEPFEDMFKLVDHLYIFARYTKKQFTEEDLTCKICNKVLNCFNQLRSHVKCHTERTKDYSCDRCGMTFYSNGTLNAHALSHDNLDAHICKICKKTFKARALLRKHVMTHNTEKAFECPHCQKRFREKNALTKHIVVHSDDMPFSCQYCTKKFKYKSYLKVHERQHTGSKPYSCEICGREFFNWSNCNKHMVRKHGTTLAKSKLTPEGRVSLNPKTLEPKKLDVENAKEWAEKIIHHRRRLGKKANDEESSLNTDNSSA